MPALSTEEYAILTARELINCLQKLKKNKTLKIKTSDKEKLADLANVFNNALPEKDRVHIPEPDYSTPPRVKGTVSPRVENIKENPKFNLSNQPTMSAQPTSPQTIQQTPITHQQVTQNNKPAIITLDKDTNLAPPRRSS